MSSSLCEEVTKNTLASLTKLAIQKDRRVGVANDEPSFGVGADGHGSGWI